MNALTQRSWWIPIALGLLLLLAHVIILKLLGRIPICECGIHFWSGAWDATSSQNFADPYSFSHVIHGFLFYGFLWLVARQLSVPWRALLAMLIEVGWEILENSPIIIDRYRLSTAALGYTGDSILNSSMDVLFCLLGFWIAWKLKIRWTVIAIVVIEVASLLIIRDNLTLNVLMLVLPIPGIKEWQMHL